jgi:Amidase
VPISQRCRGARRRAAATVPPRARRRTRWRSRGTPGRSRRPRRATAGSARIPAAACGVTGLCAAAGWIPRTGVSVLAPSCDRLGLIAATPGDVAVAWTALGGTVGAAAEPRGHSQRGGARPRRTRAGRRSQRCGTAAERAPGRDARTVALELRRAAFGGHHRRGRRHHAARYAETAAGAHPARARHRAGRGRRPRRPRAARRAGRAIREAIGVGVLITPTLPQARLAGTRWAM